MKSRREMKVLALENLNMDIKRLRNKSRFKMNLDTNKTVALEKLGLLYLMQLINIDEYFKYKEIINSIQ